MVDFSQYKAKREHWTYQRGCQNARQSTYGMVFSNMISNAQCNNNNFRIGNMLGGMLFQNVAAIIQTGSMVARGIRANREEKAQQEAYEKTYNENNKIDPTEVIEEALKNIETQGDKEKEALRQELEKKFNSIKTYSNSNNEVMDKATVITRLNNYARGLQFNQFGINVDDTLENLITKFNTPEEEAKIKAAIAATGQDPNDVKLVEEEKLARIKKALEVSGLEWEYNPPEKTLENLKTHFETLSSSYVEFYDKNNDGTLSIKEMFVTELYEYYTLKKGLSKESAKQKAFEMGNKFASLNTNQISALDNSYSDEVSLYLKLVNIFETLEQEQKTDDEIDTLTTAQASTYQEQLTTLTNEEIQAFLYAASRQDGTDSSTITALEYYQALSLAGNKDAELIKFLQGTREFLGINSESN